MMELKTNDSLCEVDSFNVIEALKTQNLELNKKRKLQAEHLGLPTSKHKCFDQNIEGTKSDGDDGSTPNSAKDSNSFAEDTFLHDEPSSTSSVNNFADGNNNMNSQTSHMDEDVAYMINPLHAIHSLEERLLEFENHEGYGESLEQCTDKELEELLYSNGVNTKMYVLSSGRWSVDQEAQSGIRKPTIDQEFEEYFSTLML